MKIISGGQTGADRAALDVAIELGLDYGGFVPRGRKAEDGPIDEKYDRLIELASPEYETRTQKNVIESDATLVLTVGPPTGGTAFTERCADHHRKPNLVVDLGVVKGEEAVVSIKEWLASLRPAVLNVAGPRESKAPGTYNKVFSILREVLRG